MKKTTTCVILGLIITVIVLLYFLKVSSNKLTYQYDAIKALQDTTHFYKTEIGNQGGYIKVIQGDNKTLQELLKIKANDPTIQRLIDSLKLNKNLSSISNIKTETKVIYSKQIDTVYKNLSFSDSVRTKWYDLDINIKNSNLATSLKTRDELDLVFKKVDNKGLWTGNTLTAFATSKNPNTNVIGITSISTVVDKPKIHIAPTVGVGVNTDLKGTGLRLGYSAGVSLTF